MVKIDVTRDELFSEQGLDLLNKYYSDGKEGVQRAIARAAIAFSYGDKELAQFIYDAASQHHFFYSSPILSNAPEGQWDPNVDYTSKEFWAPENSEARRRAWLGAKPKALPISCFLGYVEDTISGQISSSSELALLSVAGGGTALHNGIRAVSDKAPGPIPYIKTIDGIMGYYRQGKTRRGSCAVYMDIDHPDILEFIKMRTPSGGDTARKITNRKGVHNAVNITKEFITAVNENKLFDLRCPHGGDVRDSVPARELWETILETRELTGEPYIWLKDNANAALPEAQKKLGLTNRGSNLCLTGDTLIEISVHPITGNVVKLPLADFIEKWDLGYYDTVYVKTIKDGQLHWAQITAAGKTGDVTELIEIETPSGKKITCTPEHKIFTKNRGWVEAQHLVESDELLEE